jgi:hypothetical protein
LTTDLDLISQARLIAASVVGRSHSLG